MIHAFSDAVSEPSLIHRAQSQLSDLQLVQHRGRVDVAKVGQALLHVLADELEVQPAALHLLQGRRAKGGDWCVYVGSRSINTSDPPS